MDCIASSWERKITSWGRFAENPYIIFELLLFSFMNPDNYVSFEKCFDPSIQSHTDAVFGLMTAKSKQTTPRC